ncbi:scavenger receptor cysteine-rich domain-containing group B protein-like [Carettochelys insculpta]|uniref:scavenger receptor cysteine-rich domain-containing group B protein-like n=1 Tax=Carettochelys insculpta TaxID=44489 RepID=UPI003EB87B8B
MMAILRFLLLCLISEGGPMAMGISNVRLVGGDNPCAGRLEVLHGVTWGTVCNKHWDAHNSVVVCRQLGCGSALESAGLSFGPGSGPVLLRATFCHGTEQNLSQCLSRGMEQESCTHAQDVGVTCLGSGVSGARLVGDRGPCAGRVEVYLQGRWGAVCSLGWTTTSSSILCNSLGCGSPLETSATPAPVSGHSLALHGLLCGLADRNVSQCGSWLSDRKLHAEANAVVVVCSATEGLAISSSQDLVFYFWSSWIFRLLIATAVFVSIHLGTCFLLVYQKQT